LLHYDVIEFSVGQVILAGWGHVIPTAVLREVIKDLRMKAGDAQMASLGVLLSARILAGLAIAVLSDRWAG
jgi:hypothetical protein